MSSFIVGSGMFGALVMLPLYLQIVQGSTPTEAGLQTIPLMIGIIFAAAGSGIAISRTGRYKVFPVIGSLVMALALLMFGFVGADTALWQVMVVMLLLGVGLGFNMQSMVLAAQNAVSPQEMGVATSSVTFFRQMGGTLGAAVFLSVLFSTLTANITTATEKVAGSAAYQQALSANPGDAALLRAADLDDTSFIGALAPALAQPFRVGFTESMNLIFLVAAGVLLIGFVVVSFLPEVPLRTMSGVQARAADAAAGTGAPEAMERASRERVAGEDDAGEDDAGADRRP
jgi:MFS family permease